MRVRVGLQLARGEEGAVAVALASSAYEADSPQLIVPVKLARGLNLWPPPVDARELTFDIAGR